MKDTEKIVCEKDSGEFENFTKEDIPLLLSCKKKCKKILRKFGITEISKIEKIVFKMSLLDLMKECSITKEMAEEIKWRAFFYLSSNQILSFLSRCEVDEVRLYVDGSKLLKITMVTTSGKEILCYT